MALLAVWIGIVRRIRTGWKWLRMKLRDHHLLRRWLYCRYALLAALSWSMPIHHASILDLSPLRRVGSILWNIAFRDVSIITLKRFDPLNHVE